MTGNSLDEAFMSTGSQQAIHGLTGGDPVPLQQASDAAFMAGLGKINVLMAQNNLNTDFASAGHLVGDSRSHIDDKTGKMYLSFIGHALDGTDPDNPEIHENQYIEYGMRIYDMGVQTSGHRPRITRDDYYKLLVKVTNTTDTATQEGVLSDWAKSMGAPMPRAKPEYPTNISKAIDKYKEMKQRITQPSDIPIIMP